MFTDLEVTSLFYLSVRNTRASSYRQWPPTINTLPSNPRHQATHSLQDWYLLISKWYHYSDHRTGDIAINLCLYIILTSLKGWKVTSCTPVSKFLSKHQQRSQHGVTFIHHWVQSKQSRFITKGHTLWRIRKAIEHFQHVQLLTSASPAQDHHTSPVNHGLFPCD